MIIKGHKSNFSHRIVKVTFNKNYKVNTELNFKNKLICGWTKWGSIILS